MPIYMKFDGIDGDATELKHKKWITLESMQVGASRSINATAPGSAMNREGSTVSISEIVVTKQQDAASQLIMQQALTGNKGKAVTIHITRSGDKGGAITYLEYKLTDTLISSYSLSSGGDRPMESLSLNFAKIEYCITPSNVDAGDASAKRAMYDLVEHKGS